MSVVDDLSRMLASVESTIQNDVFRVLADAERLMLDGLATLRGFEDDAAARRAAQSVAAALDALRNARYGALQQFEDQSAELRLMLLD